MAMTRDYPVSQGTVLQSDVEDVQMHGGICHAITWEWCLALLRQRQFDFHKEFFHSVSMQRAYMLPLAERLYRLMDGGQYNAFIGVAEPPTRLFIQQSAARSGVTFAPQRVGSSLESIWDSVETLANGAACLIVCFGTGLRDNKNWGHTMGAGVSHGRVKFFNANFGQYTCTANTPMVEAAADIQDRLYEEFPTARDNVRDCYVYTLT